MHNKSVVVRGESSHLQKVHACLKTLASAKVSKALTYGKPLGGADMEPVALHVLVLSPAAVELRTNRSLAQVQELRDTSALVEQEARQLRTDLSATQRLAQEALDISATSLQLMQAENAVRANAYFCDTMAPSRSAAALPPPRRTARRFS